MNKVPKGVYWKTEENVYNVQIHCAEAQANTIRHVFSDWFDVAQGVDTAKTEKILIFKKRMNKQEFNKLLNNLTLNRNIILKEV